MGTGPSQIVKAARLPTLDRGAKKNAQGVPAILVPNEVPAPMGLTVRVYVLATTMQHQATS